MLLQGLGRGWKGYEVLLVHYFHEGHSTVVIDCYVKKGAHSFDFGRLVLGLFLSSTCMT